MQRDIQWLGPEPHFCDQSLANMFLSLILLLRTICKEIAPMSVTKKSLNFSPEGQIQDGRRHQLEN